MKLRALKYTAVFTLPATVAVAFVRDDYWTFFPLVYAFGIIPLIELLFRPDPTNLTEAEHELVKNDPLYDFLVRLMVPIQYAFLIWFFFAVSEEGLGNLALAGRITAMGMLCGVVGINVAHELGHRTTSLDRFLAKALLLTSLYTHFYIEHNRGHHRNVATPNDPASARQGESIYAFWFRAMTGSYLNAWKLERERLLRSDKSFWSLHNEMVRFQLMQLALIAIVVIAFGWMTALFFLFAALMGGSLLETVNYIEHYGLLRQVNERGRYERVMPVHSWNSNHILGRLLLFELTRHSDHHYKASKPYQLLDHMNEAPQLPTGYPGMMLLSLVPPLFFVVMNRRVHKLQITQAG